MPNVNIPGVGVTGFPDSMSNDDIQHAIETDILPQAQKDAAVRSTVQGMGSLESTIQGASLNWGIPAQAAVRALADKAQGSPHDFSDLYSHYRDIVTDEHSKYAAANPTSNLVHAIGGGAALAPLLPSAGIVGSAAIGTGLGAVAGAGGAKPGHLVQGAEHGAIAGGALGAGGAAIGGAYQALRAPISSLVGYIKGSASGAESSAATAAASAMGADKMQAAQTIQALQAARAGGQPVTIADLAPPGGTVQGLARQAITQPGDGRSIATAALTARGKATQQARVGDVVEQAADVPPGAVGAAYDKAYPQQVAAPDAASPLTSLLESRPEFQAAHNANVDPYAKNPLTPLFDAEGQITRPVTVRDIDVMKRTLGHHIDSADKAGTDPAKVEYLRNLADPRDEMLSLADQAAPDYATARDLAQRQSLVDDSRDALARAANSRVSNFVGPVAGATDISKNAADALRRMPAQNQAAFLAAIGRERTMNETDNFMLRGSATANKDAEAGMGGALQDAGGRIAKGGGLFDSTIGAGINALSAKMNRGRNEQLASALFDTDSGRAESFLQKVQSLQDARALAPSYTVVPRVAPGLLSYATGN